MTNKHSYRDVFKSDHLSVPDLESLLQEKHPLIFTITQVKQEMNVCVAGKSGNFNIAYFKEKIKPMVLNAGNSKILQKLAGGSYFVEDWLNIPVRLYVEHGVRSPRGGDLTSGVRIDVNPPKIEKYLITKENMKLWNFAKIAYKRDGDFKKVLEKAVLSVENQKAIQEEIEAEKNKEKS